MPSIVALLAPPIMAFGPTSSSLTVGATIRAILGIETVTADSTVLEDTRNFGFAVITAFSHE